VFTSTGPIGDEREALGTLWYHDHRMDFTTGNVYRGLAAFCLIFDHKDTDNESTGLRLPSGEYDVPLVFTDKLFNPDFSLFMNQLDFDGVLGDKFCVNGVIQPHFKVARRKYRFRLLDGGPSRFYQFHLSDNSSFHLIATDGNLLEAPLEVTSTHLGVANRRDIVIDFSQYNIGDTVYLENRLEQVAGEGPTGRVLQQGTRILRFDVDRNATDSPPLPLTLRQFPPINITTSTPKRTFEFGRSQGAWTINGQFFNPNVPMATVHHGVPEIWTLKNGGGGWSHPVHIHFEEFRVLRLNGQTPPPELGLGRHDVIALGPNDEAQLYIQFRDFQGQYVMHCHNTRHEDHAMMTRFDIAP
jgi:FtsP/CotA-like multicopper oxidase with cupredoxin domain